MGEALVEPEVSPPVHSDQVAEPHVRQLMLNDEAEEGQRRDRHMLGAAYYAIGAGMHPTFSMAPCL